MSKLEKINKIASNNGIGEVLPSSRKGKKYMVISPTGRKIHFGALGYQDYLDHGDKKRRANFHSRFKNNKGYNNPESGLYYSVSLLW